MYQKLAIIIIVLISNTRTASASYVDECREAGVAKLRDQAEAMHIDFNPDHVSFDGIDDRWYNPSKYVWFKGEGRDNTGKRVFLNAMVQKNTLSSKRCGEAEGYVSSKDEMAFVKECQTYAASLLRAKLKAVGATIDPKTVELDEIDARWYNPTKYAWFKAEGTFPSGQRTSLSVLTQKNVLTGGSSCTQHSSERNSKAAPSAGAASKSAH